MKRRGEFFFFLIKGSRGLRHLTNQSKPTKHVALFLGINKKGLSADQNREPQASPHKQLSAERIQQSEAENLRRGRGIPDSQNSRQKIK